MCMHLCVYNNQSNMFNMFLYLTYLKSPLRFYIYKSKYIYIYIYNAKANVNRAISQKSCVLYIL